MSKSSSNGTRLVSVCGKGGTGKTVMTALMTRALIESGRAGKLLVIDADPALGQLSALGMKVRRTMGQVREDIIKTAKHGKSIEIVGRNPDLAEKIAGKVSHGKPIHHGPHGRGHDPHFHPRMKRNVHIWYSAAAALTIANYAEGQGMLVEGAAMVADCFNPLSTPADVFDIGDAIGVINISEESSD